MTNTQIGLIGIGLLGSAIAERFLAQGVIVVGFDNSSDAKTRLAELGGVATNTARDVFLKSDVVFLSLPTSDVVATVLRDASDSLQPDLLIADTTTGDPTEMESIGAQLHAQGVRYVEANVAGSSQQARQGEAAIFVGGDSRDVQQVEPLLSLITGKLFHVGPVGAASRMKLVHNLIIGLHRAVLAEGLHFANQCGMDMKQALGILKQTPAYSAVMDAKGPKMVNADYTPQAKLSQHLKDVSLILKEAKRTGAPTPLSQLHAELLTHAEQLGLGDQDNSAILAAYQHR